MPSCAFNFLTVSSDFFDILIAYRRDMSKPVAVTDHFFVVLHLFAATLVSASTGALGGQKDGDRARIFVGVLLHVFLPPRLLARGG